MADNEMPVFRRVASSTTPSATPTGNDLKVNFAIEHLKMAAYGSRQAHGIEAGPQPPDPAQRHAYFSYALSSVLGAVGFIECSINELYEAAPDNDPHLFGKNDGLARVMTVIWQDVERAGALRKHDLVLELGNAQAFDKGTAPYQDASLLIAVRNTLVHYKPEWVSEMPTLARLELRIRGKFESNPYAPRDAPFFPYHCLGAGCAEWAVRTARTFVEEFAGRLGLPLELGGYGNLLSPRA